MENPTMTPFLDVLTFFKKYPSPLIVIVFFVGYLLYYLFYVVKKPYLVCSDKKLSQLLKNHVPTIYEKFWPTVWCFESRAQTIVRSFLQKTLPVMYECGSQGKLMPNRSYRQIMQTLIRQLQQELSDLGLHCLQKVLKDVSMSELLDMPDGGQVRLDWVYNNNNDIYPDAQTRPTIVLLPGLTGTSEESYVLNLVAEASKLGYRTVVFNNRGNGTKLLTPRTYCAANTDDLAVVVAHVKGRFPNAPMVGTGVSLGGMILFSYLAKAGRHCGLEAGMCVSMAWDVFESVSTLESPGINKHILNRVLAKGLVENFKKNMHLFETLLVDVSHVLKSKTIREFDESFTAPMFGYQTWQDYYKDACIHDKVHALEVPVLCLNAADDPFSPHHAIPLEEAEQNDNIAIVITSHGGHIGFMEGLLPREGGYLYRMFSQYISAIFEHRPKALKMD